jgi:2-keto-4-pentenoate hydratase/2-oxohepta-3-ene-1,7-dioic acid hydratase in catechol pathway
MKLLTFLSGDKPLLGVLVGEDVLDVNAALRQGLGGTDFPKDSSRDLNMLSLLEMRGEGLDPVREAVAETRALEEDVTNGLRDRGVLHRLEDVRLIAPIPRPRKNIVCLGLNYADHVREAGMEAQGSESLPQRPIYFTKAPTTITGPYDDILYPRVTEKLDYEVELALIIGKEGKYIPEDEVYDHIAGYSVFNDVSARDLQMSHLQWFKGKSCDTFSPMGPYLVTSDEVADPQRLDICCKVNGETRQSSDTSKMIFDIKKIVSTLSAGMTLEVGDIIATGTPSGVGSAHPSGLLKVGDVVECTVEGLGSIVNRVVSES